MTILVVAVSLVILIFSAILHEISHGVVAERLGDPTARLAGRLTLNPRKHIDFFMSIVLPLLLFFAGSPVIFAAAKPVPVDQFNLKEGRKDLALVSLAGPLVNIIIAIVASLIARLFLFLSVYWQGSSFFVSVSTVIYSLCLLIVQFNLILGIFNLIPIPPLDGSKIFSLILPDREAAIYNSLGMIGILIIFALLLFPIGNFSLSNILYNLVTFSEKLLGLS